MKSSDIDDLGFARVDLQRRSRQGTAEVVYGEGKTAEQIAAILASLRDHEIGRASCRERVYLEV